MTISARTFYFALSRLLRLLLVIFAILSALSIGTFGLGGGLMTALLVFIFAGGAAIVVWAILEILMPRLSANAFHYCAAAVGAVAMAAYWLLWVRDGADILFLPVFMIVSAALAALFSLFMYTHRQKYMMLPVAAPQTKHKKAFLIALLCCLAVTASGYMVSDYSNTAVMSVQKGESARLRYFRPSSHYPPTVQINVDTFTSDGFAENSWNFFEKNPVTLRLRSDSGCEQILRSEEQSFVELTPSAICQPDAGFHHLDVEIIDAAPAATGKPLHLGLTPAIDLKSVSYHPYYLLAQLYFGATALWLWLALWGVQLIAQSRAARSPKMPSSTV